MDIAQESINVLNKTVIRLIRARMPHKVKTLFKIFFVYMQTKHPKMTRIDIQQHLANFLFKKWIIPAFKNHSEYNLLDSIEYNEKFINNINILGSVDTPLID